MHDDTIRTNFQNDLKERAERERAEERKRELEFERKQLEFERKLLLKKTYYACEENDINELMDLVENGNPIHPDCTWIACRINNLKMLKYLVKKGAPIDDSCANFVCTRDNTITTLEFLIKKGAHIDENCVRNASSRGNMEMLKLLMENKSSYVSIGTMSICCSDIKNKCQNSTEVLEYLLRYGANPGCKKCTSIQDRIRMQINQETRKTLFNNTKLNENLIEMTSNKILRS